MAFVFDASFAASAAPSKGAAIPDNPGIDFTTLLKPPNI